MDQNIKDIKGIKGIKSIKVKKKTQVFNKEVSLKCLYEILKDILNKVCMIDSSVQLDITEFVVTKALFKRAEIHNLIKPFIETIKEHYYSSKQHYIDRQINYNNFITIIRQLCNVNDIKYVSTIVYSKSNYEIEYTIQMPLHMPIVDVSKLSGN
jgi:hypothetical protein